MIKKISFLLLVTISNGCIPTTPVTTTTIAPNTTTTTIADPNVTTTTVSTTTARPCCNWPLVSTGINNADPNYNQWDGCSQNVSYYCSSSQVNGTSTEIGFSVDVNSTGSAVISADSVILFISAPNRTNYLTCNTTSHLWLPQGYNHEYSLFGCAYRLANGSWVTGIVS